MTKNETIYGNFIELLTFTPCGILKNKILRVFKDREGFFYLAHLVKKEGLKTPFSSIEEIEIFIGVKLTLLDKLQNPFKS